MINIEYKLDIFNQIILKEEELNAKRELESLKSENEQIYENKKIDLEKNSKAIIARRIQLANSQKNEMISKARDENRERLLSIREELLEDLLVSLKEKALEFVKSENYEEYLLSKLKKAIDNTTDFNIILTILPEDIKKYGKAIKKLTRDIQVDIEIEEASPNIIGGFIISDKDKTYNLDSTFKTIIEENRYEIGKALYSSLEKAGEKDEWFKRKYCND